jgi:hypothetical protein
MRCIDIETSALNLWTVLLPRISSLEKLALLHTNNIHNRIKFSYGKVVE